MSRLLNSFTPWIFAALIFGQASSAFALFDAQALYGRRWYSMEVDDEKTGMAVQAITVAGHLGLLPIVSFGLSVSSLTVEDRDLSGADSYTGLEVGLDVLAEVPLIPIVTPYGRFNYPVMSKWVAKGSQELGGQDYDFVNEIEHSSGYILSVGVEYSPLPLLGIHLEVGKGYTMAKLKKLEVNDKDAITDDHEKDASALDIDTVMLGASVGL